jgi:hypothetical protein
MLSDRLWTYSQNREKQKEGLNVALRESPVSQRSRGSSVSIVSGYGLDDRAIEVQYTTEARFFL